MKVTFLVREHLTRLRHYTLEADSIEQAEHLLDSFKVEPVQEAPNDEKEEINDYDVLEVWT